MFDPSFKYRDQGRQMPASVLSGCPKEEASWGRVGLYTIFSIFYIRFWDLSTKNIFEYFANIEGFGGEYSNIFRI